jgi:peptidoglycan/LPS O-acetylase OafA/YrhL
MRVTDIVPFLPLLAVLVAVGYLLCRTHSPYSALAHQLPPKKGYYLELESMRGLLALAVVVHHAIFFYFLLYGQTARFYSQLGTAPVTFFFFITGFLFWSKLISTPKPPVRAFLVSRLRRLAPAYLAAVGLMFVVVAALTHFKLHDAPYNVAGDAVRVVLGKTPDLNGLKSAPWLWAVTWTLQLEFVFYLVVPFLGWFAQRLWKTLLFIGGCNALYAATIPVARYQSHLPGFLLLQAFLRFLSFTFCIGFVAAHLVRLDAVRAFARSVFGAPVSAVLILITLCFLPAEYGALESLALAIPFVAIACGCDFWGALRRRSLIFFGQISYSVYLIHCLVYGAVLLPLSVVLGSEMKKIPVYCALVFLTCPVIVGLATLWNRTFELPFMVKKSTPPPAKPIHGLGLPYAEVPDARIKNTA